MQLALIIVALAVITNCNSCVRKSICQGRGEPFNPPEIILSLPRGSSGVLRPQGSVLVLVDTREKPLPFSSDQLSLLCAPRAVSPLHPTELHQSCPMTNRSWFLPCLFLLCLSSAICTQRPRFIMYLDR